MSGEEVVSDERSSSHRIMSQMSISPPASVTDTLKRVRGSAASAMREFLSFASISHERSSIESDEDDHEDIVASDRLSSTKETLEALQSLDRHLKELLNKEYGYVDTLEQLNLFQDKVEELAKGDQMPEDLRESEKYIIVFGNIRALRDFHKFTFLKTLEKNIKNSPNILKLMEDRKEHMIHRYSRYSINYPKARFVVAQFKDFFESMERTKGFVTLRFNLSEALIQPSKYIMELPMMFESLANDAARAEQDEMYEDFKKCHQISKEIACAADNMMVAGRIENFEGDVTKQGNLISRGDVQYKITDNRLHFPKLIMPKKKRGFEHGHMFLFQQSVIITHLIPRTSEENENTYKFICKFSINKMKIRDTARGGSAKEFELHDHEVGQFRRDFGVIVAANSEEEKKNWTKKIVAEIRRLEEFGDILTRDAFK